MQVFLNLFQINYEIFANSLDYLSSLNLTERFLRDNFVEDAAQADPLPEQLPAEEVQRAVDHVENENGAEEARQEEAGAEPVQARDNEVRENRDAERLQADNGINFDDALFGFLNVVNQRDRDDPPENQGIEFVFGLKGPLSKLFLCVITVIFFNGSLMSLLVLLPTFAGKLFKKYGISSFSLSFCQFFFFLIEFFSWRRKTSSWKHKLGS